MDRSERKELIKELTEGLVNEFLSQSDCPHSWQMEAVHIILEYVIKHHGEDLKDDDKA